MIIGINGRFAVYNRKDTGNYALRFVQKLAEIDRHSTYLTLISISGDRNSENATKAVEYATENGAVTIGPCGYASGKLRAIAQHCVWVNVHDMELSVRLGR